MRSRWFLTGFNRSRPADVLTAGLKAAVRAFYADYTEEDRLSPEVFTAIMVLCEYSGRLCDDLIDEVEREISEETGRRFASFGAPILRLVPVG